MNNTQKRQSSPEKATIAHLREKINKITRKISSNQKFLATAKLQEAISKFTKKISKYQELPIKQICKQSKETGNDNA